MVKKYFRPFICSVCAIMSISFGCSSVAGVYAAASSMPGQELETGMESESNEEKEDPGEDLRAGTENDSKEDGSCPAVGDTEAGETSETEDQTLKCETETTQETQQTPEAGDENAPTQDDAENTDNRESEESTDGKESEGVGPEKEMENLADAGGKTFNKEDSAEEKGLKCETKTKETSHKTVPRYATDEEENDVRQFAYDGMSIDKPTVQVGDTARITVTGIKAVGVAKIGLSLEVPSGMEIKVGDIQSEGVSSGVQESADIAGGKRISRSFNVTAKEITGNLEIDAKIAAYIQDAKVPFTISAYDGKGNQLFTDSKVIELTISKEAGVGASLYYDKNLYYKGNVIRATLRGMECEWAERASLLYDIPAGTEFSSVSGIPDFENGTVSLKYKTSTDEWKEYTPEVEAAAVKGLRVDIETDTDVPGIMQASDFVILLNAVGAANDETTVTTEYNAEGMEGSRFVNESRLQIDASLASLNFVQDKEIPLRGSVVTQTVSVTYHTPERSEIVYDIDPGLKALSIEAGPAMQEWKAVIYHSGGNSEAALPGSIDLTPYEGVNRIVFIPDQEVHEGKEAAFDICLNVGEVEEYTCTAAVVPDEEGDPVSKSITTKTAYCSIKKPTISNDGKKAGFGSEFSVSFGGIKADFYGMDGTYQYSVSVPDYVTVSKILLPEIKGISEVSVSVLKNGKEKSLGMYTPGESVPIDGNGISQVILTIAAEEPFQAVGNGNIFMVNDNKENKKSYFAFKSSVTGAFGGEEYSQPSAVRGMTFELYQVPDVPEKDQTTDIQNGGGQTVNNKPAPGDDKSNGKTNVIQEVRNKKTQHLIQLLQLRKQQAQKAQKALLSERIRSIINASYSTDISDDENTEEWDIKPIKESLIKNTIPEGKERTGN